MRAGRLGGGALWSAWSELATVLDGGGGTGRPIVEERAGGGGGAAGAGAVRRGGSDGTLLVAALDPDASVVAETFDDGAGGARGGARGGRWNGRSGGGGGGSVGAGADDVAERGIGGGFARPAIFANHQHHHQHEIFNRCRIQRTMLTRSRRCRWLQLWHSACEEPAKLRRSTTTTSWRRASAIRAPRNGWDSSRSNTRSSYSTTTTTAAAALLPVEKRATAVIRDCLFE